MKWIFTTTTVTCTERSYVSNQINKSEYVNQELHDWSSSLAAKFVLNRNVKT